MTAVLALDDPVQQARGAAVFRRALARRSTVAAAADTPAVVRQAGAVSAVPGPAEAAHT